MALNVFSRIYPYIKQMRFVCILIIVIIVLESALSMRFRDVCRIKIHAQVTTVEGTSLLRDSSYSCIKERLAGHVCIIPRHLSYGINLDGSCHISSQPRRHWYEHGLLPGASWKYFYSCMYI
jgi:hypothetical protein